MFLLFHQPVAEILEVKKNPQEHMEHPKLLAYSTPKYSMDINWKIILGFFPRFKSIIIDDSNLAAD